MIGIPSCMKLFFGLFFSALLLTTTSFIHASEFDRRPVVFCDGLEEWPPFLFLERDANGHKTSHITGASIDILELLSQALEVSFSMKLMPWKRCTTAVKSFDEDNQVEAFTNASFNKKRGKDFWVTDSIYQTRQGLFYSKKRFRGVPVDSLIEQLSSLKLCNVHGYSHEIYYTRLGVHKNKEVFSSAKTPQAVLKMISLGRCDVFVNSIEPILGAQALDSNTLPKDVDYHVLEGVPQSTFHIYISRNSPRGEALMFEMNQAIRKLKEKGKLQEILDFYVK